MELSKKIERNLCLDIDQFRAKAFQKMATSESDKVHTQDVIRRLTNRGMKFHPYF